MTKQRITHPMLRASGTLALLGLGLLAGCASVPRDAGFAQVRSTVAQRLDKEVHWNQRTDPAVAHTVHRLLQKPLSADSAVQIALLNNPGLQADYEKLGVSQADLVQAGLLENPMLSADYLFSPQGNEMGAGVVQNFLNVFTLSARKRVARANLAQTQQEAAHAALDLAARVQTAYYQVVADNQELELLRHVVTASQAAAELASRQYQAGTTSLRDQSLQQAFYAQTLLDASRLQPKLNADREALNRLLGLWGWDTQWTAPRRLPDLPAQQPPLERLEAVAVAQRQDLAAAKTQAESLAYALGYNRQYRFLSALGIGFNVRRTELEHATLKGPSLEIGLPIFNRNQANIRRLEAELRQSEDRLKALAIDIRSQVRDSRYEMLAARNTARYYRHVLLPLQERIVNQTQRFYNGMLVGTYDLLLSKQNEINTARGYIQALRDYWTARARLEQAVGGRLPSVTPTAQNPSPAAPTTGAAPVHQNGVK